MWAPVSHTSARVRARGRVSPPANSPTTSPARTSRAGPAWCAGWPDPTTAAAFPSEVTARLLKRRLRAPAPHEPAQDVDRIGRQVGAHKGLRLLLARNVAHQHPTDRHLQSGMVP